MAEKSVKTKKLAVKKRKSEKSRNRDVMKKWVLVLGILFAFLVTVELVVFGTQKEEVPYKARLVRQFAGTDQPCGAFNAWGVAALGNDRLVVSDQGHNRVLVFNRDGSFIASWGQKGSEPAGFNEPSGVTAGGEGSFYVMDTWNGFIRGFNREGKPIASVDLTNKQFYGPRGLTWDGTNFFIADTGSHRVVKVSPAGEILKIIGSKGSDRGLFENPVGVAQGPGGNLYVADNGNSRVQVFDAAGKVLRVIKLKTRPLDVAVDSSGRLFVCTDDGNKVSVFSADGGSLGYLVDEKGSPEPLKGIRGLTVTPDGDLVGVGGDTVKEFRLLASSK